MTEVDTFVEDFLSHRYDPVKAHEYYLLNRKLKGRKAADADFEKMNKNDAQKTLNADLKKSPKVKPTRRIDAAEQKLIRARALASRIQDPAVKARVLARVVAAEHKLMKLQGKHGVTPKAKTSAKATKAPVKTSAKSKTEESPAKKAVSRAHPQSKVAFSGKSVKLKPGQRMEEDETPVTSPRGAKLVDYDGKGLGTAKYADGSVYTSSGWAGTNASRSRRASEAESRLIRNRTRANKIKDPKKKAAALAKLRASEAKLRKILDDREARKT